MKNYNANLNKIASRIAKKEIFKLGSLNDSKTKAKQMRLASRRRATPPPRLGQFTTERTTTQTKEDMRQNLRPTVDP